MRNKKEKFKHRIIKPELKFNKNFSIDVLVYFPDEKKYAIGYCNFLTGKWEIYPKNKNKIFIWRYFNNDIEKEKFLTKK